MQKGKTKFIVFLGIVLIISAVGFASYNFYEDWAAGKAAQLSLEKVKAEIQTDESENPEFEKDEAEINGQFYIGILDIQKFQLSLPIKASCNENDLKTSPGRYSGSLDAGNLIIAGHNYSNHFGYIGNLQIGDEVVFTDMHGRRFVYAVSSIEMIDGNDSERMLEGDWELSLFTCTLEGSDRITIRCKQISE